MKRNDIIFLTISLIYAITFAGIFIYQILPEKTSQGTVSSTYSEGEIQIKPTGKTTDVDTIKEMIRQGELSDKEAMYYEKLIDSQDEKKTEKEHQPTRRRMRRGRQQ